MHGSGAVSCSCSLLIRGLVLPAVRQKLHLSPCADSRSRLSGANAVSRRQAFSCAGSKMGVSAYSKPIRDKPQSASNGDERPNRENAAQPAVLQAIQTQPQPSQHNEGGYEYTCNTL